MKKKTLDFRNLPNNKTELMYELFRKAQTGDPDTLALAYLVNEVCPDDRTTGKVFDCLHRTKKEAVE